MQEANKTAALLFKLFFSRYHSPVSHSSNKLVQSLRKHSGEDYTLERSPELSRKQLHICQQAFATKIAIAIKETNL